MTFSSPCHHFASHTPALPKATWNIVQDRHLLLQVVLDLRPVALPKRVPTPASLCLWRMGIVMFCHLIRYVQTIYTDYPCLIRQIKKVDTFFSLHTTPDMGSVKAIKPISLLQTFHQIRLCLKTQLTPSLTRTFLRLLALQSLTAKTTCTRRMFTSRTSTNLESLEARIGAEESTVALNVGSLTGIVSCSSINGQIKFE